MTEGKLNTRTMCMCTHRMLAHYLEGEVFTTCKRCKACKGFVPFLTSEENLHTRKCVRCDGRMNTLRGMFCARCRDASRYPGKPTKDDKAHARLLALQNNVDKERETGA